MNRESDFVQAIAASPGDEGLVLVFADWLEEQGDPRATWVRHPAVRPWMGEAFSDPIPAVVESARRHKRILEVRRAAVAIGAPIVLPLAELLSHEDAPVRLQVTRCLRGMKKAAKEALPALMAALKDEADIVRDQAAKAIRDIGAKDVANASALREALSDEHHGVRARAAEALGRMGAKKSVIEDLARRLDDADMDTRYDAVQALGQLKSKGVVAPLLRAVEDRVAAVRAEAARQLGHVLGPGMAEAVAPLAKAMRDRDHEVRSMAALALARLGRTAASAAEALVANLGHAKQTVRARAAYALGQVAADDEAVVAPLLEAAKDKNPEVARAALEALIHWEKLPAKVGRALVAAARRFADETYRFAHVLPVLGRLPELSPAALRLLRQALRRPNDTYLANQAADVLIRYGPAGAEAIPDLVAVLSRDWPPDRPARALAAMGERGLRELRALLRDGGEGTCQAALTGLVDLRAGAAAALPELRALLRDTAVDWRVLGSAVNVLAVMGEAAAAVLPELLSRIRSGDVQHTGALSAALIAMAPALGPHLPMLAQTLGDRAWSVTHVHVAWMLGHLARCDDRAMDALREALKRAAPAESDRPEDWDKADTRAAIAQALADAPEEPAIAELVPLLSDPAAGVVYHATKALGKLRAAEAVAPLRRQAGSPNAALRAAALEALGRIGRPAAEGDLIGGLTDPVAEVRRAAAWALGQLGVASAAVLAALRAAERDADKAVARQAASTRKALEPKRR